MKPTKFTIIRWSPDLAYAIGLIVADGNLSKDGRHINFTSKDLDLALTFKSVLNLDNKISLKARGGEKDKKYHFVQFGSVKLYQFLLKIGLMPNKSKIIKDINIPKKYYSYFLRGHFDGDGSFYSYFDKRWKSSFLFYVVFMSASKQHILWLREMNNKLYSVTGHIAKNKNSSVYQLRYGKREGLILLRAIYLDAKENFLKRKLLKIRLALDIIGESL